MRRRRLRHPRTGNWRRGRYRRGGRNGRPRLRARHARYGCYWCHWSALRTQPRPTRNRITLSTGLTTPSSVPTRTGLRLPGWGLHGRHRRRRSLRRNDRPLRLRYRWVCALRPQPHHFFWSQRPAFTGDQCLLARRKLWRRRRRRGANDDRTLVALQRRTRTGRRRADNAPLYRRHHRDLRDRNACSLLCIEPHCHPRHRRCIDECATRHCNHCPRHALIDVREGRDRGVERAHDDRVVDRGIAPVEADEIFAADRIRGSIDFTRREREPRDCAFARRSRETNAPPVDKHDDRGCIHCSLAHRTGHPSPRVVQICPASVMRYGESPRRGIDPRPSPRLDP